MSKTEMTIERVRELIQIYGAAPQHWPSDERETAEAFLTTHADLLADDLSEARALDALLETEHMPEPSLALTERILEAAPIAPARQNSILATLQAVLFPRGVRWPAGAALASLTMGLLGGYAYAATGAGYDRADVVYDTAFGSNQTLDWLDTEQGGYE